MTVDEVNGSQWQCRMTVSPDAVFGVVKQVHLRAPAVDGAGRLSLLAAKYAAVSGSHSVILAENDNNKSKIAA